LGVYGDGHPLPITRGGADDMGICSIPSHRNDLAASVRNSGHRRVRGEGECSATDGKSGSCSMKFRAPYVSQTADSEEEDGIYARRQEAPSAGITDRDHVARCIRRGCERDGSPHGGVSSTSPDLKREFPRRRAHQKKLPSCTTSFKQLADIDITQVPMRLAHDALHDGRYPGRPRFANVIEVPGLFAAGDVARTAWRQQVGRKLLSGSVGFGKRAGEYAADSPRTTRWESESGRVKRRETALEPFEHDGAEEALPGSIRFEETCGASRIGRQDRKCCRR